MDNKDEWRGRWGCCCYDCWKWCKKGSREDYNLFFKKYIKL